jgi:hypothetical protein
VIHNRACFRPHVERRGGKIFDRPRGGQFRFEQLAPNWGKF